MDHNKLWKILKETGVPDHLTCLLRNLYAGQETSVRDQMWTQLETQFQIGKGAVKAIYCHLAYLTYMQRTSCKMLGSQTGIKTHTLESRLPGEISTTSDMQIIPF